MNLELKYDHFFFFPKQEGMSSLTNAWVIIRETFLFVLNCYERPICFAMPAVVKETHIPRSTVRVNYFILPTLPLLLLATDTIKQVWTESHV